jgi:hypothetical protein
MTLEVVGEGALDLDALAEPAASWSRTWRARRAVEQILIS